MSVLNMVAGKWTPTTLGELFDFKGGGTPNKKNPSYWGGDIPWASVKDIKSQYLTNTIDRITQQGLKGSAANLAHPGELVLLTRIEPGKASIVKTSVAVNQDCKIARPKDNVDVTWAYYLFRSIEREFIKRSSGTTVLGIRLNDVKEIPVDLPPLEEQKDIVAKIETLFSELDKGIESLKTARQQLKAYRQAVLKHAFEGKLTEQWRQQNPNKLEPPERLLARIQQEREQRYQQQLEEWKQTVKAWEDNGKDGKKPSKSKVGSAVQQVDESSLPVLPEGWAWVELSTIMENIQIGPFGSLLHKADYVADGVPLINPSHIKDQKIVPDWNLTVTEEKLGTLGKYVMQRNDIVIGRRGEMGRCAVITDKETGWLCGTGSLYVRPLNIANSDFYSWIVASQRVRDFLSNSSIGTTMQNLNEKILKRVPVPVCSVDEQSEIVRQINSQYSVIDKLEEEIDVQIQKSETLRQSILKKAFSGQLVNQACKEAATNTPLPVALVE